MTKVQTPPEGTEQEPVPQTPAEPTVEPTPAPEPPVVTPPAIDYEEKFKQSSAEAQLLFKRATTAEEKLNKLNSTNPTDDELRAAHPGFDQMDDLTKGVLREQAATRKWRQQQELKEAEAEAERQWRADLASLIANPAYAHLSAEPEFETFAVKYPKGVDLQTIADSYMVRNGKFPNAKPPEADPTPDDGDGLIPGGSGGPRGPRKTGYTAEEVKDIRTNDPKRYQDLLEKGLIKIEID